MPVSRFCVLPLVLVACSSSGAGDADATGGDGADATLLERGDLSIEGDAGTLCEGPNPTNPNDSGSYCVRHAGMGCFDEIFEHLCVDGVWQCPEPDMILVRECRSFGPQDVGGPPDFGFDDAQQPDAGEADLGDQADVGADEAGADDAEQLDSGALDDAGEPDAETSD